ncbi:TRAP transporter small permease [Aliiroseovarius sp. PTFE2010]|uniref:TRAP transporter small permease n=1 Tax=Aliiroseovarius sp. PTFE2010 TaxID=3417190 RepID=UPI003CF8FC92
MPPNDLDPQEDGVLSPSVGLHGPLGRAMDRVDTWANFLSRAAMTIMLVLILIQVFTRYILNDPIEGVIGATELYLMPIIVFGSLSYLEMYDGHVRVGILFEALPDKLRAGFNVVLRLAAAAFFALVCYGASREALKAWDYGYRTSGDIDAPLVTTLVIAPIGCVLIVLRLLVNAAGDVQRLRDATDRTD